MDLDAFFCSVEEILDPELRGRAFVVGGSPEGRGVVTSASYPARKYGIRSAMPMAQALRRLPSLLSVSGRHGKYSEYSRDVMQLLRNAVPIVEQISIDEAFLDVTDDHRSGEEIARELRSKIIDQFKLPTSWGIASSKLVAKIASEVGKPNGLSVVPGGEEEAFLAPLPVEMLWGVGPKSKVALAEHGIRTIGDLAQLNQKRLIGIFGERGIELAARGKGLDTRPVIEWRGPKSVSNERTFVSDITDAGELHRWLRSLSEMVGRRLREAGLAGKTVRIKLRWSDFTTITRQLSLEQSTDHDHEIFTAALELLSNEWKHSRPVRLLGVGVSQLGTPMRQLQLFDRDWEEDDDLLRAVDTIRSRFGGKAIRRADSLFSKRKNR
jgi:DNA polymerase-4